MSMIVILVIVTKECSDNLLLRTVDGEQGFQMKYPIVSVKNLSRGSRKR